MNFLEKVNSLSKDKLESFISLIEKKGEDFGVYPLSKEEEGLYCSYKLDEGKNNPYYNICFKIELKNYVDYKKVITSINELFNSQEVFKYKFIEIQGKTYQYVDKESKIDIEEVDLSSSNINDLNSLILENETSFKNKSFILETDNPIRFKVIKINETRISVLISIHHIISDGWSVGIITKSFINYYFGIEDKTNHSEYGDYIIEQKNNKEFFEKGLEFWKKKLGNSNQFLDMPTVFKRDIYSENKGKCKSIVIPSEISNKLREEAKKHKCSIHAVLLSIYYILLNKYADKKEINVGTPLANRENIDFKDTVGFFATTIVLPLCCSEDMTFSEALDEIRETLYEGLEYQNIPLQEVLNSINIERREGINPLFQTTFSVHSKKLLGSINEEIKYGDTSVIVTNLESKEVNDFQFDLSMIATEATNGEIELECDYLENLFTDKRIDSLLNSYVYLASQVVENENKKINEYSLVNKDELEKIYKDKILNYEPKVKLNTFNISKDIISIKTTKGKVAVLDERLENIPSGFFGDIYYCFNDTWFDTGESGCIDEDGNLIINEEKSKIVQVNNEIINKLNIENELKEKFNLKYCKLNFYKEYDSLVVFYDGSSMVNAEIFNSLNRFKNLIVYKTENYKSLKCENLLNGLLKSEKELSLEKDIEEFIVIQNECEVSFDIVISTKNKKPLSKDKVIDIEKKIKNENINIKFIDKFIREDNIIDFSKVNKDKLFSYGKKQKDSTEEKLYIIWSEILGNNNFTIYDKFYEVGGNSLKSLRLLKKINEEFNVEINIAKLFECNSISEQAEHLNKEYLNINNKEEVEVLKF